MSDDDALGAGMTTGGATGPDAQDCTDGFLSFLAENGISYGTTLLSCQGPKAAVTGAPLKVLNGL